MNAATRP